MNCTRFYECISLYIDNELNDIEMESFEKHLKECENCRVEYEEMLLITNLLKDVEEVELPEDYEKNLRQKLEVVEQVKKKKINYKKITSFAAGIIVLITSITFLMENNNLRKENRQEKIIESRSVTC